MDITLFGGVSVGDGSIRLNPRDRAVLAVLAMRPGEPVEADRLADALWGDAPPVSWVKNLQGCIVRLRKALGSTAIQTSPQGYRLHVGADEIDAQRFERLVARGRELLALDQPERAAYLLGEALELWQGRPLLELEDWDPGRIEAGRLDELRLEAEEVQVDATLQAGHHRDVLARAQALADEAPLRERRWELLARAQYQAGRQTDALRTIHRVRRLLVEELGLDPSPSLEALEQAILRQDPTLSVEEPKDSTDGACPYQGLTPYDVDDAESFFGRDEAVAACLNRLRGVGVLAVVGPSGSGKSSLIRAGVAASLRRDRGRVVVIAPGAHPADALSALPRSRAGFALVVDQLEEVFSLCADPVERDRFLLALTEHARTGSLVVSLRADHLGDLSGYPDLAKTIEPGLFLLSAMSEEQLRAAIEGPAHQAGLMVEPGLVDLLIREVKDEPGALPLLSHVLRETWLRRESRNLTVAGYQASGGVRQAVAQSAEAVFQAVGAERQGALRDLLLRMVAPSPTGAPVRTRMPRRLVVADGQQDDLIDILVASRLVTSDDEVVEIAHEALARAWPRLRAWLDDDIEGQRLLHHLTGSADAWDSLGRPDSELYRGTRLTRALEWRTSASAELTSTERDFLDAGRRQVEHEERNAVERARIQARLIRRLRGVLAGASLLLVAALIAGGLAVQQKRSSDANASAALTAKTASDARRVGAKALVLEDLDESMLLAAQGALLDRSPETTSNLLAVLAKRPGLIGSVQTDASPLSGLDVSQDGRTLATYDTTSGVRLYDTQSWQVVASRMDWSADVEPADWSGPVAFNPDGLSLAVGMPALRPRPITLVDSTDLEALPVQLPGQPRTPSRIYDLDYSADGSAIAATFLHLAHGPSWERVGASVVVWDISKPGGPVVAFRKRLTSKQYSNSVVLSRNGRRVYTSSPLTAFEVDSGKVLYSTHHSSFTIALAPDDRTVAISGNESRGGGNTVLLVDAASGTVRSSLRGHSDTIAGLLFSPDRNVLVSSSGDRSAAVWDLHTGEISERFSLDEVSWGMGLSPDGATLYTAGDEGSVRSWDLAGDRRSLSQVAAPVLFKRGFINPQPGAAHLAYFTGDNKGRARLRFLDVARGEATPQLNLGRGFSFGGGSWQPITDRFVSVTGGVVRVWNARTGQLIQSNTPAGRFVSEIDYSPDGSRLVIGELSGRVTMLDARTLEPLGRVADVGEPVCCLSASPDNRTALVLTGGPGRSGEFFPHIDGWSLVDLVDGREIERGDLDINGVWVTISPDGTRAAIAGWGGEVAVLDLKSGELVRQPVRRHEDVTNLVAFSPDGSRIVSAGWDGTVSLWNSATGVLLGTVTSPARIPASTEFLPDGRTVLIASYDEGIYLWDTRFEHAIHFACQLAGRNFTESEWRENFGDRPYRETCPSESSH